MIDVGGSSSRTALQQLLTVSAARRSHAYRRETVIGQGDRRWQEWRLSEVLRTFSFRDPDGDAPPTDSPSLGLTVPTLSSTSPENQITVIGGG